MGRDYAARSRKPAPPFRLPAWLWMTAGLSLGLAVAVLVYIGRPVESMPMVQTPPRAAQAPSPAKAKIELEPARESEFDFYKLLRQQEVEVPPEEPEPARRPADVAKPAASAPKPSPAAPTPAVPAPVPPKPSGPTASRNFAVALGSFSTQANADALRAQLLLSGVESRVYTIRDAKGRTLYQVRTSADSSEAAARTRMAQIQRSGFEGRVVPLN